MKMEKEMATHSSILAWKIPQTDEPGVLQFTGSQRVRSSLATEQQFLKTKKNILFKTNNFLASSILEIPPLFLTCIIFLTKKSNLQLVRNWAILKK